MGFLNPAALGFSVFIAALIALYLWERNQRRLDVPSLLLWHSVPEAVAARRRFNPDRLFWVQAAVFTALILALANPFIHRASTDSPERTIIILDQSASMQAREGPTTRFDIARKAASRTLHSLPRESEVLLISAAGDTTWGGFTDRDTALAELSQLSATDTGSNLGAALATAKRSAAASPTTVQVHVYTDLRRNTVDKRWREGMHWWPVGESDDNLAVTGITVDQGALQDHQDTHVVVSVRNFSGEEKHSTITFSLAGEIIGKELFTAAAGAELHFELDSLTSSGVFEARISDGDALAVDNFGYGWIRPSQPIRVALVCDPSPLRLALLRLGAAADMLSVRVAKKSDLTSIETDVVILHGDATGAPPRLPSLTITGPGSKNTTLHRAATRRLDVLDWNERHPVLEGIDPQYLRSLPLAATEPRSDTEESAGAWGEVVLMSRANGQEIPLLRVGTDDDTRRAILAIDMANENLLSTDREGVLLLLLNLIEWLARPEHATQVLHAGDSWRLDEGADSDDTVIVGPGGETILPYSDQRDLYRLQRAGVHTISIGKKVTKLYANFVDSSESNIGRRAASPYQAPSSAVTTKTKPRNGLRAWFLLFGTLMLLGEWILATRGL